MQPCDRVILATPEPSWIEAGRPAEESTSQAHRNMLFLEQRITDGGATIPVRIAGDLHHYARYQGHDGRSQLITCGGGGAFLHGTFGLPGTLNLQTSAGQQFDRVAAVPTPEQSEEMCGPVFWKLLLRNRWFAVAVGAIYWLYSWLLQSASEALNTLKWNEPASKLFAYLRVDDCISWKPWTCSKVFWA